MKGCDKFCTYCIVPFTRGREKSRLIDEVVDDVAALVDQGVREITLLGQNVNSFGKKNIDHKGREPRALHNIIGKVGPKEGEENFPQLLRAIDEDPRCAELKRIRFTSSHPLDFSDELIELAFKYAEKINSKSLAIDFVFDGRKPLFVELSYGFPAGPFTENCTGYWDRELNWHQESFSATGWMIESVVRQVQKNHKKSKPV